VPRARRPRPGIARYAAPAGFLVAVTIVVLLIRSGLHAGTGGTTTGRGPITHPTTATAPPGTTRKRAKTTAAGTFYTVQSGDTFGSISAKTGVPVSELEQLNPGVSSNTLRVGQRLRVK
jgi:LysM repeat protein